MEIRKNSVIVWGLMVVVLSAGILVYAAGTSYAKRSVSYCDRYARNYADRYANTGGDVVGGAVGGAALGALFGAIAGAPATGAGIGAGVGALGGGVASANDWPYLYNRAYNQCMGQSG
jgi:outer membrane lipoprotein SlyB